MVTMLTPSFYNAQLGHGEFHNFDAERMERFLSTISKRLASNIWPQKLPSKLKNKMRFVSPQTQALLLCKNTLSCSPDRPWLSKILDHLSQLRWPKSRSPGTCIGCELAYAWFAIPLHVLPHSPIAKDFQEGSCWLAALTRLIIRQELCFCGALGDEAPDCPVRRQQFGCSTQELPCKRALNPHATPKNKQPLTRRLQVPFARLHKQQQKICLLLLSKSDAAVLGLSLRLFDSKSLRMKIDGGNSISGSINSEANTNRQ